MDKNFHSCNPELWGGIECTINRIRNRYKDQLTYSDHYTREGDLDSIADLGITALRYPVLWEHHEPASGKKTDWDWTEKQLTLLRKRNIQPIVGLIHHGSGPIYTALLDDNFPTGLAGFATKVADKFPWVEYYTPVNEPLTTARFSGIYGIWYPHHTSDVSFARMLLNQVKAVVLSMQAIRKINPKAKLVQTEDLGKTYCTPYLQFQADFENERRWLTFDLLCGKVDANHTMWKYFGRLGIPENQLYFFLDNPCPPDIMGFNHYVTSERYIDERFKNYPPNTRGGNDLLSYADVEAVRVKHSNPSGLGFLLTEAWDRFNLPMAITEVQLNSTREEQLRWFFEVWSISNKLKKSGIDIRAVTAWSLLGAFGWNRLLTSKHMEYEPGVFDIRSGQLRPTALVELIKALSSNQVSNADIEYLHPVLKEKGWWHRETRFPWIKNKHMIPLPQPSAHQRPVLIIGKSGTLGSAFARICQERIMAYRLLGRSELDITVPHQVDEALRQYKPWAVINAGGYVKVDEAETDADTCLNVNVTGAELLAKACRQLNIQFLTFSSDLVFDGNKGTAYLENDLPNPLNIYGKSKLDAENAVLSAYPESMVVRTSSFFGPWDKHNFVYHVIKTLSDNNTFFAADDIIISPTYVPDLVNVCLDLLIDKESGIWHITNGGEMSWLQLALATAERAHLDAHKIVPQNSSLMNWKAVRPAFTALQSIHGQLMPSLDSALDRYFDSCRIEVRAESVDHR